MRIDDRVQVGSLKIGDWCTISPNGLQWEIYDIYENNVMMTANGRTKVIDADKKVWYIESIPEEPTLVEKIIDSVEQGNAEKNIAKKHVLHHLKQLKAQMGEELKAEYLVSYKFGIQTAMNIIDKKIVKINTL